jgi:hypothetical protein
MKNLNPCDPIFLTAGNEITHDIPTLVTIENIFGDEM